jgi:hypothetical protein
MSVGGIVLVAVVLVRMPADYFSSSYHREFWVDAHPFVRGIGLIGKNILGLAIVIIGIVLSLPGVPGPGLLIALLGLTLVDFPGKRPFERWLISRPRVFDAVNRMRTRRGKAPFHLEDS